MAPFTKFQLGVYTTKIQNYSIINWFYDILAHHMSATVTIRMHTIMNKLNSIKLIMNSFDNSNHPRHLIYFLMQAQIGQLSLNKADNFQWDTQDHYNDASNWMCVSPSIEWHVCVSPSIELHVCVSPSIELHVCVCHHLLNCMCVCVTIYWIACFCVAIYRVEKNECWEKIKKMNQPNIWHQK